MCNVTQDKILLQQLYAMNVLQQSNFLLKRNVVNVFVFQGLPLCLKLGVILLNHFNLYVSYCNCFQRKKKQVCFLLSFTAEADKSVDDPGETAALVPPPGSAEDKPKEEAVEQSPPPPVELSVEEKTDDEGVVSNKTSVESLKETNENNSNSADFSQKKGWYLKFVIVIPCTN